MPDRVHASAVFGNCRRSAAAKFESQFVMGQCTIRLAAGHRGQHLPITPFLQHHAFEPEVTRAMGVAFEDACRLLRLPDTADPAAEIVATKIIELAKSGEHDASRLCNGAVMAFQRER
jgi:hypothetical protein